MPPVYYLLIYLALDVLAVIAITFVAVKDALTREIPNGYVYTLGILGFVVIVVKIAFGYSITVNLVGLLLTLPLIYPGMKGKLGGGDYKLLLTSGLYLGAYGLVVMAVIGAVSALVPGLIFMFKDKSKTIKLPLGPFIAIGFMSAVAVRWAS